jgi:ribosomal protein L22
VPGVTVEEIVRQMLRASRWLYLNAEQYGMDEDRLYVSAIRPAGT